MVHATTDELARIREDVARIEVASEGLPALRDALDAAGEARTQVQRLLDAATVAETRAGERTRISGPNPGAFAAV